MFSNLLPAICLLAAVSSSIATPVAVFRNACVALHEGRYTISSAVNNWQLRPYSHPRAPPGIAALERPPSNDWGVWEISRAPQNAYYIRNVGQGTAVSNLGRLQPYTLFNGDPSPYGIECAGNGLYIIRSPVVDEVWTADPRNYVFVRFNGANGDITQRFKFTEA